MTPPGSRWITVHPAGDEHEGRPVLIKDDGSGTVLGGMGGQFNGQKLGSLYKAGDRGPASGDSEKKPEADKTPESVKEQPEPEQPAKQQPDPNAKRQAPSAEPEPTSHEAHARYNPHLPDYEDLGPELQAAVHGVPTHAGEGRGWQFHLRNAHLDAMSKQGYGALPGGLLLPHPEGGVVYHQHGAEHTGPDDYESALHSMATDVAGQVHEHLGREHERRMRDEEDKTYHEETERELAAWQRTQYADVRKAIAGFGGIARFKDKDARGRRYMDAEYDDYVPRWARNQSGLTPDRARHALNEAIPHLELATPSDLFDYLDHFEDERAGFRDEQGQRSRAKAWAAEDERAGFRDEQGQRSRAKAWAAEERRTARAGKKETAMVGARETTEGAGFAPIPDGPDVWLEATERVVRESTVQDTDALRANITREGRGYRIKDVQLLSAGSGNALMGNTYEPEAVEALVREVQRQPKCYRDHSLPSEVRERGHRSLRDLAGVYDKRTVRYDATAQACVSDLILRPSVYEDEVAPVLEAGDNLGISVDGVGHCPERPRHVKGWRRFNSADLVPAGGARGMIVREANSPAEKAAEKEFAMSLFDEVSSADVRESAPALFEQIGREYAAQHAPAPDHTPAAPPTAASTREEPPQNARLAALESRVREAEERAQAADARVYELEAEGNKRAVAAFVDAVVRECGLSEDKQVAFVAQRFAGATMGPEGTYSDQASLDSAVREAAEEFKAVLPPAPGASWGQITGMGRGNGTPGASRFATPEKQNKVVVDAVDWLFGAPSTVSQSHEGAPNGAQAGAGG